MNEGRRKMRAAGKLAVHFKLPKSNGGAHRLSLSVPVKLSCLHGCNRQIDVQ